MHRKVGCYTPPMWTTSCLISQWHESLGVDISQHADVVRHTRHLIHPFPPSYDFAIIFLEKLMAHGLYEPAVQLAPLIGAYVNSYGDTIRALKQPLMKGVRDALFGPKPREVAECRPWETDEQSTEQVCTGPQLVCALHL